MGKVNHKDGVRNVSLQKLIVQHQPLITNNLENKTTNNNSQAAHLTSNKNKINIKNTAKFYHESPRHNQVSCNTHQQV
jgi:hypothetical protein